MKTDLVLALEQLSWKDHRNNFITSPSWHFISSSLERFSGTFSWKEKCITNGIVGAMSTWNIIQKCTTVCVQLSASIQNYISPASHTMVTTRNYHTAFWACWCAVMHRIVRRRTSISMHFLLASKYVWSLYSNSLAALNDWTKGLTWSYINVTNSIICIFSPQTPLVRYFLEHSSQY